MAARPISEKIQLLFFDPVFHLSSGAIDFFMYREENESDSQYFDRIFESIEPFTDALVTGVSVIDITETDDRYIVRIRVSSMISCKRWKP